MTTTAILQLILLVALTCSMLVGAGLPVIGIDGLCKPAAQIATFLERSKVGSSNVCPVIGAIDLTSDGSGCGLLNSVLSTSLLQAHIGICIDGTESAAVLLAHYDSMFSSKFCGSKAVDFVGSLANTLVVVLPEQEIAEVLSGHDQTMRRLATAIRRRTAAAGGCQIKNVFFLSTREGSAGSFSEEVIQAFDGIWGDVCVEDAGSARISPPSLTVLGVNVKDAESLASAKAAVLLASSSADVLGAEEQKSQTLGSKIFEAWAMVSSGIPRAIFSPSQRQSVYAIESAFAVGIAQSEAAFNQWQARIGSGKVVGKFGSRVQELLDAVHKRFMEQTKGSVSVRERAQRARQLRENIESVANVLFRQQISLLQTQITKQFRRSLIRLAVSGGNNEEEAKTEAQSKEEEQQVRKALFDFRALALELEVESIGLVSNAAQTELSTALQTMATEFPESSFGRLEAVKKLERETKRPKKKGKKGVKGAKGKRAINIGLNLVGMLRPPGYGNLQGFVGYSTALLGLPFEILMGVQNDGDSPEVMGEDREYPLLRLQPKVSFDIDM